MDGTTRGRGQGVERFLKTGFSCGTTTFSIADRLPRELWSAGGCLFRFFCADCYYYCFRSERSHGGGGTVGVCGKRDSREI